MVLRLLLLDFLSDLVKAGICPAIVKNFRKLRQRLRNRLRSKPPYLKACAPGCRNDTDQMGH